MSKAEFIIKYLNGILAIGLIVIPVFTGLLRLNGMPIRKGFSIISLAYLVAFIVAFVTLQFLIVGN